MEYRSRIRDRYNIINKTKFTIMTQNCLGTASVARGYSGYIDSLFNGTIQKHFEEWVPINVSGLSSYPDVISFGLTIALTSNNLKILFVINSHKLCV